MDNKQHKKPHIHAEYQDFVVVIDIESNIIIEGNIPPNKLKLVTAWIEIHKDELLANWKLAIEGKSLFNIEALK